MSCYRLRPGALPVDDVVESMDHVHLDPVPRVAGVARAFVLERSPGLPPAVREVLLLLTSELVTNAVIHARTPLEVGITVSDRSILVTVHDENLETAPSRASGREGGWGLGLVRDLADEFAMDEHPGDGKTAWFRLSRELKAS